MRSSAFFQPSVRLRRCLIALAVLGVSCGPPDGDDEPFESQSWVVEGPTLRIGSVDDPEFAFGNVVALSMSPTGVLHSLHGGEATVRRWTDDGRPAGVLGGRGEGPGEFDTPGTLGFFGDSLWVMDRRAYRVSYFDLDGTFLGTVTPSVDMSQDPDNPNASAPRPSRPLRDGTLYGVAPAWSDAIARGQLSEAAHVWMDANGRSLGTVWIQPYRQTDVLALLQETGGTYGRQPFGDGPLFQVSSSDVLVVVDRRAFDGGETAAVRLTKIAMTGDTLLSRAIEYVPEPLARETVDSAAHAEAERMFDFMQRIDPEMALATLEADLREAIYGPSYLPAVRSLVPAEDGSTWLQRFSPTQEGLVWWVLGEDGEVVAEAVTPEGLHVLLITGDAVWGVETDEFDVSYIVRYDIVREQADAAQTDTLPLAGAAAPLHEDVFVAAAETVIDFLRGDAEFDAISLSDTVTFYLARDAGGAIAKVPGSDLRDRTRWRIQSDEGQTFVLAPPVGSSRLTTRFGRHLNCFEYALEDDFPDLAQLPHVGTTLEPENRTSCRQTWNLTLVFQDDARPPRLAAVVYDQWEW